MRTFLNVRGALIMDEKDEFTIRDQRSGASKEGGTQLKSDWQKDPDTAQDLDFSTFIISLASSAQVHLGALAHPETNQIAQNFPAAKQMIDILTMLQTKTKGNLTEAETALLEQVLYSLRMHYVRATEGQ